jgi:hypothetical protein
VRLPSSLRYADTIRTIQARVEDYVELIKAVNEREALFGFEVSKFEVFNTSASTSIPSAAFTSIPSAAPTSIPSAASTSIPSAASTSRSLQVLQTIQLDLEPFAQLWITSFDFKLALPDWKFGPFLQLNFDDVQVWFYVT